MDNARAHKAKANTLLFTRHFVPVFNVPHSCQFNSIEHVWSVAKHNFAILSLQHHQEMDEPEFDAMALRACKKIPRNTIQNLVNSNRAHLEKFLLRSPPPSECPR